MENIKDHEVLRRFRIAHPRDMHLAIEAAFLCGFRDGIHRERERRSEEDRILGNIGLSRAEFLKYRGKN